jgi:hypothetical protein
MFKPAASLLEPDVRFRDMVVHDANTGDQRAMRMDDLRSMVASIELAQHVPVAIRERFDLARNAFVYSWFVYEFAALAEQQCYAILEMALRHRLDPGASPNTTRSPGLDSLLKTAVKREWLRREDFLLPSVSGSGGTTCLLDFIPLSRNHLLHGNIQLDRKAPVMRLCADVMNRLFANSPNGPQT